MILQGREKSGAFLFRERLTNALDFPAGIAPAMCSTLSYFRIQIWEEDDARRSYYPQ
jgi:hypothetical protein